MKLNRFVPAALMLAPLLSSCMGDDTPETYEEWRKENTEYFNNLEAKTENGVKLYQKVSPVWDPSTSILMRWVKDCASEQNKITPLDNSTIDVKYLLTDIKGDTLDSSYKQTAYGDSIFRCKPCEMITGFWVAVTRMHIGDSVTTVIPYTAAYGMNGSGSVLPYSTLTFQIKLVDIKGLEYVP